MAKFVIEFSQDFIYVHDDWDHPVQCDNILIVKKTTTKKVHTLNLVYLVP